MEIRREKNGKEKCNCHKQLFSTVNDCLYRTQIMQGNYMVMGMGTFSNVDSFCNSIDYSYCYKGNKVGLSYLTLLDVIHPKYKLDLFLIL